MLHLIVAVLRLAERASAGDEGAVRKAEELAGILSPVTPSR